MKRLIFSDVHLHTWQYGARVLENGFNSRLWSQKLALDKMLDRAAEEGVKYAYFGGDFFHTPGNVPTQALQVANEFFQRVQNHGIQLYMLAGNHDMASRNGKIHALAGRQYVTAPGQYRMWRDGGTPVHTLGYTTDSKVIEDFLKNTNTDGGLILMHQGVAGVPLSSGYVLDERLTAEMIPENCEAFTGHYHFYRAVSPRLTVIGNLSAINWSDIDQRKGYILWDDVTGNQEWIESEAPRFVTYDPEQSVENCFVRYCEEVSRGDISEIRKELLQLGAIAIEFPSVKLDDMRSWRSFKNRFNVVDYIKSLEEDMEERRKEVGVEVRGGCYETP